MKPIYIPNFIDDHLKLFEKLLALNWMQLSNARKEYFMADKAGIKYKYPAYPEPRTYESSLYIDEVLSIRHKMDQKFNTNYDLCFLNRYDTEKNSLSWHSDSSPEMNSNHPIAVISLGCEREIWWKKHDFKGLIPEENRQLLGAGSLFIMPAGFQQDYLHRIPKGDHKMEMPRISLTFRNHFKND